jgi:eukaryotic-like serine/threonine-protein kinase
MGAGRRKCPDEGASGIPGKLEFRYRRPVLQAENRPQNVEDSRPSGPRIVLAKYDVLEELGHGGMATVYRGRDRRLGREVALKVIHRHLRENAEVARRFASEALAVAKLKHPGIVEVYDVSEPEEEERYLVVELIVGKTLRQLLLERGALPPEIAASIAIEVCRALAHAHRHGIVHRDVKPENVLLCDARHPRPDDARVKLTDFGIAKLLDAQGVTQTGQVLGSPAHMAPEQIEGGDVDARSDVFAVGVLLYEMLTGALPFGGKNPAQVLRNVLEGAFEPVARARPVAGARYGELAAWALSRDASLRPASADELADALEAELKELGFGAPRTEVGQFLEDPAEYVTNHLDSVVARLTARGAKRRTAGDFLGSTADFNRALAYRPHDTMLLSEVAGIARTRRQRRRLVLGAWITAGMVGIAASAWGVQQLAASRKSATAGRDPSGRQASAVSSASQKAKSERSSSAKSAPAKSAAVPANEPAGPVVVPLGPSAGGRRAPPLARPTVPEPQGVRSVRTPVVGPQNARVRIDGVVHPWFQVHELGLGMHTFEFLAPNEDCCVQPAPMTVEITAGTGPQFVRGTIRFRDATITLDAPPGARASCGVAGGLLAGQTKVMPMGRSEERIVCTLFGAPGARTEPERVTVELRPGQVVTLKGR